MLDQTPEFRTPTGTYPPLCAQLYSGGLAGVVSRTATAPIVAHRPAEDDRAGVERGLELGG